MAIELPSVTRLGCSAFEDCTALAAIDIPCVHEICNFTFANCPELRSIQLDRCTSLTEIGAGAFKECTALAVVNLPSSLLVICD